MPNSGRCAVAYLCAALDVANDGSDHQFSAVVLILCTPIADYLLVPPCVRAYVTTPRTASYGHQMADRPQGTCSLCRSAAVSLELLGVGPQSDRRLGPGWPLACAVSAPFAVALPRPMYRITCPYRTQLHAHSQVLARHRGLTCRITGHYPMASSDGPGLGNRTAAPAWVM
jgi:hypothetical protein